MRRCANGSSRWGLSVGVGLGCQFCCYFDVMLCYVMLYFQELFVSNYLSGVPVN